VRAFALAFLAAAALLAACADEQAPPSLTPAPRIASEATATVSPCTANDILEIRRGATRECDRDMWIRALPYLPGLEPSPSATPAPRRYPATYGTRNTQWGEQLHELTIPDEWADQGFVQLKDSEGRAWSTRSTASVEIIIRAITFGDLNNDGNPDAAIVLMTTRGGSGTGWEVAAVVDEAGTPRFVTRYRLGSDIGQLPPVIRDGGTIMISTLIHDEDDHKHEPSFPWLFELRLQGNELIPRQPRPVFYGGYGSPPRPPTAVTP
jgi:hypothetical protein